MSLSKSLLILKAATNYVSHATGSTVTIALLFAIPVNHLTVLASFATVGGLYFFFSGFLQLSRKHLTLANSTTAIRSTNLGPVEVNGKAAGPYTLPATISGQPCFLYQTTAWQQSENKKKWEKVAEETLHLPFFISDSSGQLLVEPLGANLDLPCAFQEEYDVTPFSLHLQDLPPRVSDFLSRHNIARVRGLRIGLRIEERLIQPGDTIFATGTLTENPGIQLRPLSRTDNSREKLSANSFPQATNRPTADTASQPAPPPEIIKLSSEELPSSAREMTQQGKIAAALNRAGITKPEAWSAAGVPYDPSVAEEKWSSVATEVRASRAESQPEGVQTNRVQIDRVQVNVQTGLQIEVQTQIADPDKQPANAADSAASTFEQTPPFVLMTGADNSIFTISSHSRKQSVKIVVRESLAMVWGGAVATLFGLYTLLSQLGIL